MTVLERLGAHAAGGYRGGVSASTREALRLHLADTVGAWIAACATGEGRTLRAGSPDPESLPGRVALHCALARLSEVDDIHRSSAVTPGAIVVSAALTLAGALEAGGTAVGEAIAAGYDLMTRFGAALDGPAILYRGIWPTYFAAPFGVAAVAARLLELTEGQAAHALAIALALASPAIGRPTGTSTSRWFAIGNAARNGVAAAFAAQKGFSGDLRLFEGEFFPGVYRLSPDIGALAEGIEARPAVAQTSFKPWCAAKQTMAAAQALREIIEDGVPLAEIESVAVGVPPPYLKMIDHGVVPGERMSYLTSAPYQVALAGLDPDANLDLRQAQNGLPQAVERFMAKISVVPDPDLLRHYPQCWPARLVVETAKGRREKLVLHVPGDPERPFDELQIAVKFWRLTSPLVGERSTEDLLRLSLAALDGENGPSVLLEAIERAVAAVDSRTG
jgi:2-methylcitrate dehydratase PrpD